MYEADQGGIVVQKRQFLTPELVEEILQDTPAGFIFRERSGIGDEVVSIRQLVGWLKEDKELQSLPLQSPGIYSNYRTVGDLLEAISEHTNNMEVLLGLMIQYAQSLPKSDAPKD